MHSIFRMANIQLHKPFAIYSAVVGNYDEIKQPCVVDERFDYILFTNEVQETNIGVWQIRPVLYTNKDNTRICRYVKTHPEELLPGYKASVWMDSNIQIARQDVYDRIVELYERDVLVASMCHPWRNCIYQEAFCVLAECLEEEKIVLDWGRFLRKQNYPRNNGLFETNVLYRRHTEITCKMDELWWQCIDSFSKRDQLSFNYVLWEKHIPAEYFLPPPLCARNTNELIFYTHKHDLGRFYRNDSKIMRYYQQTEDVRVEEIFFTIYGSRHPHFATACWGRYYLSILWFRNYKRRLKNFVKRKFYNSPRKKNECRCYKNLQDYGNTP